MIESPGKLPESRPGKRAINLSGAYISARSKKISNR